jgi:hypothetical protein
MSNETNVTNAFVALLTGGGVVAAVNENATFISICIGVLGLLMGLLFHLLTLMHRNKVEKRNSGEYRQQIKNEVIAELKAIEQEQ